MKTNIRTLLVVFAALMLALQACMPSAAAPTQGDIEVPESLPTATGTMPPAVQEAISDAPIAMAIGVVYAMPAGYVLAADVDLCVDPDGYECYRTYDSDGTTIAVVSFDEAGYFARLPFGDGTATKITDQVVLDELVANQATDGCGTGCTGGASLLRVPGDIEAIKVLAASFAPAPTATPEPPTDWNQVTVLNSPPAPELLPDVLMAAIVYQAPPENCADANDPNETCTTRQKQPTLGMFDLQPNEAIVSTGDNIDFSMTCNSGVVIAPPVTGNKGDVWVLLNVATTPTSLCNSGPHGEWRGFFTSPTWSVAKLQHLLELHLQRYQTPDPDQPQEFQPTPCPVCNCIPSNGCVSSRVRVGIWDGANWRELLAGQYSKTTAPYWFPR